MKKILLFIAIITATIGNVGAQNVPTTSSAKTKSERLFVGLGVGLDYGVIGVKVEEQLKYFGLFAAGGFYKGFRYNIGGELYPINSSENLIVPVLTVFYGYNGYVSPQGFYGYQESYNLTVGGGLDVMFQKIKLSPRLFYPFRNELMRQSLPPIALSIGLNFKL